MFLLRLFNYGMIMVKNLLLTSLIGLVSFSSLASETPLYTECSTCFSFEQFKNTARLKAKVDRPRDVYVMNLDKSIIEKFNVSKTITGYRILKGDNEPDGRGGHIQDVRIPIYSWTVDSYGVEQDVLNTFHNISDAKSAVVASLAGVSATIVPKEIAGSAWDLVGFGAKQYEVSSYYNEHTTLDQDISNFTIAAAKVSGVAEIEKVFMQVAFDDKSIAIYSLFGIIGDELIWDFEHGRDVDGNKVEPTLPVTSPRTYTFKKGGLSTFSNFYDAAVRSGAQFYSTSAKSPSSAGRVSCVGGKAPGSYICTYTK